MERIDDIDFILAGGISNDPDQEDERDQHRSTSHYFSDKKALLIGLPGAFTPTCTVQMLPDYELLFDKFKAIGIDVIYCTAVNYDYVMEAWARAEKLKNIEMIPDGNGELAESLGMLVKKENKGMGNRSWRYVMYVDDGEIIREWSENGKAHNSPVDPYEDTQADRVYKDLCDDFGIQREDLIEEH